MDNKEVLKAQEKEKKKRQTLMFSLKEDMQADIISMICKDVDDDESARTEFIAKIQEIIGLYEGIKETKSDPFPNCANVKTMIIAMVVELLHCKLYPSVYNEDMTYWIPQEKSDISTADNIGKFMKWATRSMRFGSFVDDFVKNIVLEGTVVAKVRWEEEWRWVQRKIPKTSSMINRIKNVFLNIVGIPRRVQVTEQDYEVIYDYKKFENCVVEIVPIEDVGFPVYSIPGADEDKLSHIWHRTNQFLLDLKEKESLGWFINTDKLDKVITDEILKGTEKIKLEAEGVRQINLKRDKSPLKIIEWYGKFNIPGEGYIECIFWVEKTNKIYLGGMPLINVSRINRRPFVISQLVRRTNRMYGKSIGEFIKELQKTLDSIYNQHLDAGTMAIIPPGVYRAASGFTPEEIQIKPGLWIPVDDVNDIKYLVMPNNILIGYQVIRMIMELIEKISSAGAYQSGQESDVIRTRATARGTLAIIAQGEQRFMTLAKRIQLSLSKVLVHVLQQYQQNIPPGLEQRILGDSGESIFPEGIAPEDIAGNYDVYLAYDTTGGSKILERQTIAILYEAMIQNPLIISNPAGLWELTADAFRAAGKIDVERYIGPKPQMPTQVTQSVRDENMLLLQGKSVYTKPTDNVLEHYLGHIVFRESPEGMSMTPEARRLLDLHILETTQQFMETARTTLSQTPNLGAWTGAEEGYPPGGEGGGILAGTPAAPVGEGIPTQTPGVATTSPTQGV